jgi:transglutaminase-like putative cysteine protease
MALVDSGDAGAINRAFNLLLGPRPDDAGWRQALQTELGQVRFGQALTLRRVATAAGAPRYSFSPAPSSTRQIRVATRYTFTNSLRLHDIPYVDVNAEVRTAGYRAIPDAAPDGLLTSSSPAWPTQDPRIRAIVDRVAPRASTPRDRLAALHGWVHQNIPQGGAQLGARRGTLATLQVGHGRCWERSDVLVTLLRAAGVPTRQVAGWVDGLGGHIWVEAYLTDVGWIGVDVTAPWIGVAGEYIPLLVAEDGAMSVFYLSAPKLEREGCLEDG